MARTETFEYVKGLGEVHRSYAPLIKQLNDFKADKVDLVSVRDAAYIRVNGKNREYTRTCHAPICAKDSPVIIARISPAIGNPKMLKAMVDAHRANKYPVLDPDKSIYREWEAKLK